VVLLLILAAVVSVVVWRKKDDWFSSGTPSNGSARNRAHTRKPRQTTGHTNPMYSAHHAHTLPSAVSTVPDDYLAVLPTGDDKRHYERGAISRAEAEQELRMESPGAFVLRQKGADQVLSVLLRQESSSGGGAEFVHNVISQRSPDAPVLLNKTMKIGSPVHCTDVHDAIVYLATSEGAAEVGLAVPLIGVAPEETYGVVVSGKPERQESGHYGQAVYGETPIAGRTQTLDRAHTAAVPTQQEKFDGFAGDESYGDDDMDL